MTCPLCSSSDSKMFFSGEVHRNFREYLRCFQCDLVYMLPKYFLSSEEEKAIYDTHKISLGDARCRHFFVPIIEAVKKRIATDHPHGLDFGCGQVPLLAEMFREQGIPTETYDKFYHNNPEVLCRRYDFVVATEVFEHLSQPIEVLEKILSCLSDDGILGIMTKILTENCDFKKWYYKNDPTHVVFYSEKTFHFLSEKYCLQYELHGENLIVFQRT